jgi:uncharacterized protein
MSGKVNRNSILSKFVLLALTLMLGACSGDDKSAGTPAPVAEVTGTVGATAAALTQVPPGTTAASSNDVDVTFTSGADTIHGSLMTPLPGGGRNLPAAVIISGSGPTDRNGNSPILRGRIDTNLNFARALAGQGIASLRYDKLGTGKTGLGSVTNRADIGFDTFLDEARAAYGYLATRPEVDPRRLMLLGHSEGALIALVLAGELQQAGPPRALVLAAPPGARYLDVIRRQLAEQAGQARQAGQLPPDQERSLLAEVDSAITGIRETGMVPDGLTNATIRQIFSQGNAKFLAQVDRYDPPALAAGLPPSLPALILRGEKDQQVTAEDARSLLDGFRGAGNTVAAAHALPNVNHVFKEVLGNPNPSVDYGNPALPFSHEAVDRLSEFVRAHL